MTALQRATSFFAWSLYQVVMAGGLLLSSPFILARRGRHYKETLLPRLGAAPSPTAGGAGSPEGRLWIHAVSVGEVGVAATLLGALPEEVPAVVTTVTPTGQDRARKTLSQRAEVTYLPFDFGFAIRRFLRRYEPGMVVLTEGDQWPLLLHHLWRRELPVAVVNGRISDRSFARMERLKPFLTPLFRPIARFAVQTSEDRRRLLALGVPPERVTVTGNLKYETEIPPRQEALEKALKALAAGRPILVAGSTMGGEEEAVLDAFAALGGGERALLVLVPRHPERWDEVAALLAERSLAALRRSYLDLAAPRPSAARDLPDVVLLDSLGELASLYRIAAAAFVGGTLVPTGGHNPLEPARFGVPTAVGPSMENFREIARHFDEAGAWARVKDAGELGRTWKAWLEDPEAAASVGDRALGLLDANRGALAKTLEVLAAVFPPLAQAQNQAQAQIQAKAQE